MRILIRLKKVVRDKFPNFYQSSYSIISGKVIKLLIAKQARLRLPILDEWGKDPEYHTIEKIIIPHLISCDELYKVLYVGCDWYTKPYKRFFNRKEYWTIEIEKEKAKYGAENHIIDSLLNLGRYFKEGYFDLIICNGVFGWGINTEVEMEKASEECFICLRRGGILVLGWDEEGVGAVPVNPDKCESLKKFKPYIFPSFSASQYLTNTSDRHFFNFYIKP